MSGEAFHAIERRWFGTSSRLHYCGKTFVHPYASEAGAQFENHLPAPAASTSEGANP